MRSGRQCQPQFDNLYTVDQSEDGVLTPLNHNERRAELGREHLSTSLQETVSC